MMLPETIATLKEEARKTTRTATAMVVITWAGSSVDNAHAETLPEQPVNRASIEQQVLRAIGNQRRWAFCETDNPVDSVARLDENICAMPDAEDPRDFLVGWWGSNDNLSDNAGNFVKAQELKITFAPATISGFRLHGYVAGDAEYAEWPVNFDVTAYGVGGAELSTIPVRDNSAINRRMDFAAPLRDVEAIGFKIYTWSRRGAFVKITAAHDDFTLEHNADDIMSLSLLEEAEGSVGTLPIGNVSCNELDLVLQNIDRALSIGNTGSKLSGLARANRRVEPFIGFDVHDENGVSVGVEYAPKGVYWSRDWNLSLRGSGASTSALDRLGLLQEIEYNGIGNIGNPDAVAERSYWRNATLYTVADEVLQDLRQSIMPDMEYDIDAALKDVVVPLAFFDRQTYFEVVRTIAQAGVAYAYMDIPNEDEVMAAKERGNTACADILRIKRLEHLYPVDGDYVPLEVLERAEKITMDDFIDQSINARRSDMANIVAVPWAAYELDEDGEPKRVDDEWRVVVEDERSIRDYGRLEHEYQANNLVQTEARALKIANGILKAFGGTQRVCEMSMFGDVTSRVGDVWEVPEYQRGGIDSRGVYSVVRLGTEYSGGLRQSAVCRRVGDAIIPSLHTLTVRVVEAQEVVEAPVITQFSVDKSSIESGESVTLQWTVENADTVELNGYPAQHVGMLTTQPSVIPVTIYTLTAKNSAGEVTRQVGVHVNPTDTYWTDPRDNQKYRIVVMPDGKTWLAENMRYDDGASMPNTDPKFGRLYSWPVAMEVGNIDGFRVPSVQDWEGLISVLGSNPAAELKATPPEWDGTDSHRFTVLPGGYHDSSPGGGYSNQGNRAYLWTSTESTPSVRAQRVLIMTGQGPGLEDMNIAESNIELQYSLRLVRD